MRTRTWASIALGALGIVAIVTACSDDPTIVPCKNIPAGGCPRVANGCIDATCDVLYVCMADGTWKLDRTCPPREDAGLVDAGPRDVGAPRDVDIDVLGAAGGPGCGDLQPPDCSLSLAATCPSATSCCGCEDLFVCQNRGWEPWGTCGDNGVITPK